MVDQFDGKGPFVDRLDLDGQNFDGSPVRADAPRCALDVKMQLVDGSVLSSDVLRLQSFSGEEGISQPFEFKLDLRADDYTFYEATQQWAQIEPDDKRPRLIMDALLGASVTVMIGLPETEEETQGAYPEDRQVSYFNGVVFNVSMMDRGVWSITMKPRLSLLGLQSSYRIFEEMTILHVIEKVLADNNIHCTSAKLRPDGSMDPDAAFPVVTGLGTYRTQSWLQGGETDLDFINRLMEKAGLFFYFVHSENDHIMVLTDQSYYQHLREPHSENASEESLALRRLYLTSPTVGQDFEDTVSQFSLQRALTVQGISTILARKQAAWLSEDPANVSPVYRDDRLANPTLSMERQLLVSFGASERELDIRKEQLEKQLLSSKSSFSGSSGLTDMRSGYVFALQETRDVWEYYEDNEVGGSELRSMAKDLLGSKYPEGLESSLGSRTRRKQRDSLSRQDLGPIRPELDGAEMVAVSVSHNATIDGKYSNQFTAYDRFGYGKAFDAVGDQEGTIVAQVCDKAGNADRSAISTLAAVTKFAKTKSKTVSRFFMPKRDFVEKYQKTFSAQGSGDDEYKAQGVYVQFINSGEDTAPVWVRLSDGMTTIPERGTFVMVSRARDETEIPEVSQVLDSVGSRTVMPKKYSKNTSWGDSFSTSYGDSYRVSVPNVPQTEYETFTELVNGQRTTGAFNDVSFSESASSNFNVAAKSRSVSVSGPAPPGDISAQHKLAPSTDQYAQVSQSITYGDSYNSSEQQGDTVSKSQTVGTTTSTSKVLGDSTTHSTTIGNSDTQTEQIGNQTNVTTIAGDTHTTTNQTGDSTNVSTNTSTFSVSATAISVSTNTVGDSVANNNTEVSFAANVTGLSASENVTGINQAYNVTGTNVSSSETGTTFSEDFTGISETLTSTGIQTTTNLTGVSDAMTSTGVQTTTTLVEEQVSFENIVASQNFKMNEAGIWTEVQPDTPKTEIQGFAVQIIVEMHISL
jgi:type VI secretion system secreted protein VgrG